MENILNYGSRVAMLNYGYRSTARHFRAHFDTYRQAFAAYGIDVSLEGLQAATGRPESALCRACLTREYPTRVPVDASKLRFEASAL